MKDSVFKTGELVLNTATRQAYLAGEPINLPKLSYRFIEALVNRNGKCITTAELISVVWDGKSVSDDTITQRASLVRKSLSNGNHSQIPYFETIRGEGYRWLLTIENESTQERRLPQIKSLHKYLSFGITLVALIAFLFFARDWSISSNQTNTSNSVTEQQSLNMFDMLVQRAQSYGQEFNADSNQIALDLYMQALTMQPRNETVLQGLTLVILHRVSKFNGANNLLVKADEYSLRLLSINDESAYNIWLRGFYYDVSGNIVEAIVFYETALALAPDSTEVKGSLAYLYVQKGRLLEAMLLNIDTLGSIQEFQLLQIAEVLMLSGLNDHAPKWYERAHKFAPDNALAAVGLARYYFLNNELSRAKTVIENLHRRGVNTADSHLLLSLIYIETEQYKKAQEEITFADSLKPNSLYITSWQYWLLNIQNNQQLINSQEVNLTDNDWPNLWIAAAVIAIADNDLATAISRIQKAEQLGFLDHRFLRNSIVFRPLDGNQKYETTINQMIRKSQAEQVKIKQYALPKIDAF